MVSLMKISDKIMESPVWPDSPEVFVDGVSCEDQ